MPFRTYDAALKYLATVTDYERLTGGRYSTREYNLVRMHRLLDALGNPQDDFPSIHVAGTKGKGSTCHFIEAICRSQGLRTGLYTSPHLVDMLERIRLDGDPVGPQELVDALNEMRGALDRVKPTYFEIMTAAAFWIFAKQKVHVGVIEVGMGGRLDATNVIFPEICAITRIDYDHMDKLGHTLTAIASEKAGIIKPGVPVFTTEVRPEPLRVIVRTARHHEATLHRTRPLAGIRPAHQAENAGLAVAVAKEFLGRVGNVKRILQSTRIPGRVETIAKNRILDVAHNGFAMRATAEAIADVPRRRLICVFGASADKNYAAMMAALKPDLWILTQARSPRACPPEELARHAKGAALITRDVGSAVALAEELAKPRDLVLYTGSFYVAGEVIQSRGI